MINASQPIRPRPSLDLLDIATSYRQDNARATRRSMGRKGEEGMGLYGSRERVAEYRTTQRVARAVYLILVEGGELTTSEMATQLGMSYHGAKALLDRASEVVPIWDDEDGVWRRVE